MNARLRTLAAFAGTTALLAGVELISRGPVDYQAHSVFSIEVRNHEGAAVPAATISIVHSPLDTPQERRVLARSLTDDSGSTTVRATVTGTIRRGLVMRLIRSFDEDLVSRRASVSSSLEGLFVEVENGSSVTRELVRPDNARSLITDPVEIAVSVEV